MGGIPLVPHATGRAGDSGIRDLLWYERRNPGSAARRDPSGGVRDAGTGAPVPGARVTLWYRPFEGAEPEPWDASSCGQGNPLVTDAQGSFSWEVPEGWYQVRVEAEGYRPASGGWFYVPSAAELDVPVAMELASSSAGTGGVPSRPPSLPYSLVDLGRTA